MADNTERPFGGIKAVINGENESVCEYEEEIEQESELPSVSTFHEVDTESQTPALIEFDHHGEIIIRQKISKSVDEFHTESTKPTIVPKAILEGNHSVYPRDKPLDLVAENGITPTHGENVKCGNNKKVKNTRSRIPLSINKVKSSTIKDVEHTENITRRSRIPKPIKRKVKKPGVADERSNHKKKGVTEGTAERSNHKKKGVTETAAERSNHKKKGVTEVADERFNHKKKGPTETVKICTKKLSNAYKRAMQNTNFKLVKKNKEERCRAKEAAREFNERVRQGNKRRNVNRSAGNIANRPDQNETASHGVPNKRRVAQVRSSMVDRKVDHRGRGIGRMDIRKGATSREGSTPRHVESAIADRKSMIGDGLNTSRGKNTKETSNDQVLLNQDSEMGDCVPNLHVLAEMKAVLVKQIEAVQREIIALKDPDTEASEALHTGQYTYQMFDDDSDKIQEEIWEIKRLIITMKQPDQSSLQELESRIMEVKGENKRLERNLRRINFKEKDNAKELEAVENVQPSNNREHGVSCTGEDDNNVHKPTTIRRPSSRFFKNRVAPLPEESRYEALPDIRSPKEANEFEDRCDLACKDGLLSPSILESFNICLANLRRNPQDASTRQTDVSKATEMKQGGKFTFKGMFQKLKAFFTK